MVIDGGVERRSAEFIGQVHIGARLNQGAGCIVMTVDEGHDQRRQFIVDVLGVQLSPGSSEQRNASGTSLTRGKHQWGLGTKRHPLFARLCGVLPLPDFGCRPLVDIGTARNELLHHVGMFLSDGPHQCRLPLPCFLSIDFRAIVQEHFRGSDVARTRGRHQSSLALG